MDMKRLAIGTIVGAIALHAVGFILGDSFLPISTPRTRATREEP